MSYKDVSFLRSISERKRFACRIDQGTSVSFNKRVVSFTASILHNLLHICFPVDLGIYMLKLLTLRLVGEIGSAWKRSLQGIFQMIRTHRQASATSSKGDSHFVCFGLPAMSIARVYRSISPAVVERLLVLLSSCKLHVQPLRTALSWHGFTRCKGGKVPTLAGSHDPLR